MREKAERRKGIDKKKPQNDDPPLKKKHEKKI